MELCAVQSYNESKNFSRLRERSIRIGLVELPAIKLCDENGQNWAACRQHEPLVSKQILISQLRGDGFDASLVNLKRGISEHIFGEVSWKGLSLKKIFVGTAIEEYSADRFDVWGFTVNYTQEREIACRFIRHLTSQGARVIVGGSDALAVPAPYLEAGATSIVADKSGAINRAAIEYVMGRPESAAWQQLKVSEGGRMLGRRGAALTPELWPLPEVDVAASCLGTRYWEGDIPDHLLPIGSVVLDIGCDRKCDFCQTPNYKLGYKSMSPKTAIRWFARQKEAGARSVICVSDQFLGRVLWDGGRDEVLEIMQGTRDLDLPVLWGNGLEIKKATRGHGLPGGDPTPDERLCKALWGWDGRSGCYNAYIPGERPVEGNKSYEKLLPWNHHVTLLRAITQAGVPDITYGIIVGMSDDSDDTLSRFEDALYELWQTLISENHDLRFRVTPFAIRPLPGTLQTQQLERDNLLVFEDPAICGGFWTACANTKHITYERVSYWQSRLAKIGDMRYLQGAQVTGVMDRGSEKNLATASF